MSEARCGGGWRGGSSHSASYASSQQRLHDAAPCQTALIDVCFRLCFLLGLGRRSPLAHHTRTYALSKRQDMHLASPASASGRWPARFDQSRRQAWRQFANQAGVAARFCGSVCMCQHSTAINAHFVYVYFSQGFKRSKLISGTLRSFSLLVFVFFAACGARPKNALRSKDLKAEDLRCTHVIVSQHATS